MPEPESASISVLTFGQAPEPPQCTGEMLCECADCREATVFLMERGGQGEGNASPFKTRKAA